MFHPLLHKTPYGATAVGQKTTFVFPLDTALGVKRVFVVLRKDDKLLRVELPFEKHENGEDYFVGNVVFEEWGIWHYRFEGEYADGTLAFFGRDYDGTALKCDWLPEWQLTVSKYMYKTPDWAKTGVIYQIFADRFCKGEDRIFDRIGSLHADWYERPDYAREGIDYRADDFFGGNIKGIISKLDYLSSIGVSTIYLSPIFKSSSNHRYDTGDYLKIDELFGDEVQFAELIERAKEYGINIILDGVFNHTGADSIYFNKFGRYNSLGAYQSKDSSYRDWYYFNDDNTYHCWWGSTVVPTVNKSAQGYKDLLFAKDGVIEKWTKMGVKGWRLDVVDELPIDFTDELCTKIKEQGEDTLIIGEVWEDASTKVAYDLWRPYFMGGQLDGVMNYPFKEAILQYAKDGDKQSFIFAVENILENYPKESLDVNMNLIGSHDTARALTALGCTFVPESKQGRAEYLLSAEEYSLAIRRLKLSALLQFTLPGVPCVFYGDEAGMQGFEDPLNRGTYPWGRENQDLINYYTALGHLRKDYKALLKGETHFVRDEQKLIFERTDGKDVLRVECFDGHAQIFVNGKDVFAI